jgi:tetratricopeptide (TPR) repeat protein
LRRLGSIRRPGRGQAIVAGTRRQTVVWALLCLVGPLASAETCESPMAKVFKAQGQVELSPGGTPRWQRVGLEQSLCPGDRLRLGPRSRATVRFANQTLVDLDEGSTLILHDAAKPEETGLLELLQGALHAISRVPRQLDIRTPIANAGVEGTEFALRVDPARAELWVYEGRVLFENTKGQLRVEGGEAALARAGEAPERRIVVKPRQAVEWALYYPPLLDSRPESYPEALRPVVLAYRRNDFTAAFAALDGEPEGARDARYHTLRAGLLLSVGRVPEAEGDLTSAERLDPKNGTAYALRSVIAVVRNEGDEALKLALEAVRLAPGSATPYVARSYAEQSAFEIEPARESLKKAAELAPDDALVFARLAELELSRGDLDAALTAATKAETLDADLARTQTVLGFAYLTRIEVDKARAAFDRAIARDPADPLPRLGLGLAKIRDGDLDAGTEEIETAAALDPNNSLVRSYLGKAYFEQKRGGLAETEFEQAKLLDPKDPTPWFYDAIQKQTENRPVEALHDLQRAIERNDNRAVYRSRLDLDEDRAARSTSLARIYDDLGFTQRGLVEASKTLSLDLADYSAHRFLSDTYGRLPRHQIARVSELLQAQLLQPININPVQPQLNERILNIVTGAGPARAAFNEYSRLFERNRPQLILSGVLGNNDTFGDEAVLSGIHDRVSYSLGQFHYQTDGFREKADVRHDIYNGFAQIALTDKFNIQFEYRHRDTDQGDLRLRFDPLFTPTDRRDLGHNIGRLGLHMALSPQSDVIGSLIYSDRTTNRHSVDPGQITDNRIKNQGYDAQGQYLFHSDRINFVLGGGVYNIDRQSRTVDEISPEPCREFAIPGCRLDSGPKKSTIDQSNVYSYANITFPNNFTWTLGLGYDSFDNESVVIHKVNPKFGLQWDINVDIRFRAAYLETLKRQLVVEQTVEPTQVAGFNQFFDDSNGTLAELYGIGLDAKLSENAYGGCEFSRRNLDVPIGDQIDQEKEDLYRAYGYWTPHSNWALSAEYRFERFRGAADTLSLTKLETASIPLSVRYFSPLGVFGEIEISFVRQEAGQRGIVLTPNADEFYIVDAALGYRLPKRRGIVSLEITNLLDEKFLFDDLEFRMSDPFSVTRGFIPDRSIIARVTLSFF